MVNFVDREPTQAGRRKITYADGTSEYVTISMADNPNVAGTPLNRANLMALQGFENITVTFNTDGSITERNANGEALTTTFNADDSITERFVSAEGIVISKTTTIDANGNVTEVVNG